jgi:hypothetical protein
MKNLLFFCLILVSQFSCVPKYDISPRCIIGNWEYTFESRYKDKNGKWSDWEAIPTLLAWNKNGFSPQYVFSKRNKFSIINLNCNECNYFKNYKLINNQIFFYNPSKDSKVSCEVWEIEKLTENELIVIECGESRKYKKIK